MLNMILLPCFGKNKEMKDATSEISIGLHFCRLHVLLKYFQMTFGVTMVWND